MTYSTLYAVPHVVQDGLTDLENGSKAVTYGVGVALGGSTICHGQPGEPIPADAVVYRDGSSPWTWNEVIAEFPELADVVVAHEYAGEPTAANLDVASFVRMVQTTVPIA